MNKLRIEGPVETERCHRMGRNQQNKSRLLTMLVSANLKKRKNFWSMQTN